MPASSRKAFGYSLLLRSYRRPSFWSEAIVFFGKIVWRSLRQEAEFR
jgi:hypothetical protein